MAHGIKNYEVKFASTRIPYPSHTGVLCVVFQLMPIDARDDEQQSRSFRPVPSLWFGYVMCFMPQHRGHKGYIHKYLMSFYSFIKCCLTYICWVHYIIVWSHQTECLKPMTAHNMEEVSEEPLWSSLCRHLATTWLRLTPSSSKNGSLQTSWTVC